ncbi:MAG: hypothetical protein HQL06_15010 [Nitrospirae bacterium]|nr:hypothetical protein [Nitrospirota bacterium]
MLEVDKGEVKAWALLSRVYANKRMLDRASECCEKAIGVDSLNPGYYYLAATILEERGMVKEAMAALKKALYIDHDYVLAHFAMGNLTMRLKNYNEAQRHFSNALKLLLLYNAEDILPESEGIPVSRLKEIIETTIAYVKIQLDESKTR